MNQRGLIEQLAQMARRAYPQHTLEYFRKHFLEVVETHRCLLEIEGNTIVGYLEYKWVPGELLILHVTELLTLKRGVIWKLRKRMNQLPWQSLIFRRQKTGNWESYFHPRRRWQVHV